MNQLGGEPVPGGWMRQLGAARVAWAKLTEYELLKSEGHPGKLAGLVQVRYALTHEEAEQQVKRFLQKQDA